MWTEELAHRTAERWLAGTLPRRWDHVSAVASRAQLIGPRLDCGEHLVVASWLHDIGYAAELSDSRFHPIDGARALSYWGVDASICGLVAHHSAAAHEAAILGLRDELETFTDPDGIIRDLLWYLDMTTSPYGDRVSFNDRMDEVRARYPADHYVSRALDGSMADRRNAVDRAEAWLSEAGLAGQV